METSLRVGQGRAAETFGSDLCPALDCERGEARLRLAIEAERAQELVELEQRALKPRGGLVSSPPGFVAINLTSIHQSNEKNG